MTTSNRKKRPRELDADAQRRFAQEVVEKLRAAGHEALWAGGSVRDQLLGQTPKDYDVATSALPEQVRGVFGRRRTIPVGAAFGVITVLGPRAAGQIEVATFRTDAGYSDGRRPDAVRFTDAEHDAGRRDFTINGLFFDPVDQRVIDYVGGERDLRERRVRAIGDPDERIEEDKLRMLRAVRFAAALGFAIDDDTRAAIERHAPQIEVVSPERIGAEVARMLTHASRATALGELQATGLLPHVLPETAALSGDQFARRCGVLDRLESPSLPLALAAVLPREATPPAGSRLARRLRLTSADAKRTDWILDNAPLVAAAHEAPWPKVQRVLAHPGAADAVALREAELGGPDQATRFCREKLALPHETLDPPPLVTGRDLTSAGVAPGPGMGRLLERIRDEQLEGRVRTRAEAIEFAKSARD